jgi:zinc protease
MLALLTLAGLLAADVRLPQHAKSTLASGATLILTPRSELPLISLLVTIRGGIEAEAPTQAGLASLTAELLRRGTTTRTAAQISEQLDALGATLQTAADGQAIRLNAEFLAADADRALDILADLILRPSFPEDETKKALAQALDAAKANKDNPQAAAARYHRAFFHGARHPYGRAPLGDELSLAKLTRADVMAFHRRLFQGRNAIIVAAGLLPEGFRAKLEKTFGAMPTGAAFTPPPDPGVTRATAARLQLVDKPDATQTYFLISQPGIRRGHPDEVPLRLINTLFGDRFTSMLNDELRVNSGLTYGARSSVQLNRLTGGITISTFTKTETTAQAIDLALATLRRLHEKGITAEQLDSAKAYVKGTLPLEQLETADQVAAVLANIELFGLNRGEIDDLFSKIDTVTLGRANAAIRQYYRPEGLVFTLLGNASAIRTAAAKYAPQVTEVAITKPGY